MLYLVSQRLMADDEENMVLRDTDLTETVSIPADVSVRVSLLVFGNADGHWERIIRSRFGNRRAGGTHLTSTVDPTTCRRVTCVVP